MDFSCQKFIDKNFMEASQTSKSQNKLILKDDLYTQQYVYLCVFEDGGLAELRCQIESGPHHSSGHVSCCLLLHGAVVTCHQHTALLHGEIQYNSLL